MQAQASVHSLKESGSKPWRAYRAISAQIPHSIPVGTLVELESGARFFVVSQLRDRDQTPLYNLSLYPEGPVWAKGFPGWALRSV